MIKMIDIITLKRLELDRYDIDYDKSFETYNQDTYNHIITIYLNKETDVACQTRYSKNVKSRSSRTIKIA